MTRLQKVTTDAIEQWIAHLCNRDVKHDREWLVRTRAPAEERAAYEARVAEAKADLEVAKRHLRKHRPHSPLLAYELE